MIGLKSNTLHYVKHVHFFTKNVRRVKGMYHIILGGGHR